MTPTRHFVAAVVLLLLLTAGGTFGYASIEGWSLRESLYMTVITLSTVGYGEVHPLSPQGQWFSIAFVMLGFAFAGFAVAGVSAFIVQGELRTLLRGRRLDRKIANLQDHYIVCGCGAVGREIASAFQQAGQSFVVVEINLDSSQVSGDSGFPCVEGDATQEEVLQQAGIERARGLIAALHDDPENVFVTLTARQLNADLHIIARANEKGSESKLRVAGANHVISPFEIAGRRMAATVLRPNVSAFLDTVIHESGVDLRLEEITIAGDSRMIGRTLRDADLGRLTGCVVVGLHDNEGRPRAEPGYVASLSALALRTGDRLIVLGSDDQLQRVGALAASATD
ncbi:MAG: potassium channel protein [Gemmatimonadetes bacterium]|jgi:voltage-gated potassium channel|nr:potassium channel protein [Gemmatimonadota bacterium]MBT7862536.1 potassium channel protein [Gemmatimonadota bacterium]